MRKKVDFIIVADDENDDEVYWEFFLKNQYI